MKPPVNMTPNFPCFDLATMSGMGQRGAQYFSGSTMPQAIAGNEPPNTATNEQHILSSNTGSASDEANSDPNATHTTPTRRPRWNIKDELMLLELCDEYPTASWADIHRRFFADGTRGPTSKDALESKERALKSRNETISTLKQKVAAEEQRSAAVEQMLVAGRHIMAGGIRETAATTPPLQTPTTQADAGTGWSVREDFRLFDIISRCPGAAWWQIRRTFIIGAQPKSIDARKTRYEELLDQGKSLESLRQDVADLGPVVQPRWSQDED